MKGRMKQDWAERETEWQYKLHRVCAKPAGGCGFACLRVTHWAATAGHSCPHLTGNGFLQEGYDLRQGDYSWGWLWNLWQLGNVYWLYLLLLWCSGSTSLKEKLGLHLMSSTDLSKNTTIISVKIQLRTIRFLWPYALLLFKLYLLNYVF